VKRTGGKYSVGDELTMADIVLAPTVEAGIRWGVDFSVLQRTKEIYDRLKVLPCFEEGDWRHQEDTPEALRGISLSRFKSRNRLIADIIGDHVSSTR